MSSVVIRILTEQRKRMLASILRAAEQSSWWGQLPRAEQEAYRACVVSAVNVFYELCRDIVKVSDAEHVGNEEVLEMLQRIHESQRRAERRAAAAGATTTPAAPAGV